MTIAIFGTGGHAKSIYDIVKRKKIYFFDNSKKKFEISNKTFEVIGDYKKMLVYKKKISKVIIAIGNNKIRESYYKYFKKNKFKFSAIVHPRSYFGIGVEIGEGTVLMPGSIVNTDTFIGNNCIINSNASIDHDCVIKDHTHICPGVTIAGNVEIGKNCWIGLGSKIIENCKIGDNVFVAAGTLITKNIKSNSFLKGVPGRYATKKLAKF